MTKNMLQLYVRQKIEVQVTTLESYLYVCFYQVPSIDHVMYGNEHGFGDGTVFYINKETRQTTEVSLFYNIYDMLIIVGNFIIFYLF